MKFGLLISGTLGFLLIIFGLIIVSPVGKPMLRSFFPTGEIIPVVWGDIRLDNRPARYLICPGYELCDELNDRSAIFDASLSRLLEEWNQIVSQNKEEMELILSDDSIRQYSYLIRSPFLQLPDIVTVQFFEYLEDEDRPRSSIAIYSRRVYVSGDFGANSNRVFEYIHQLESALSVYRRWRTDN